MAAKLLGNVSVGSIVKLNVSGTAKEFIVVHQGLPSSIYDDSCNGTWLLMKDIYEERQWHSSKVNDYENSTIHSYLNSTFLAMFDSNIQNVIKQVKIPYVNGTGSSGSVASGANGLSAKIFPLSVYEVGSTVEIQPTEVLFVDGECLSYFSPPSLTDTRRIAYLNGTATLWWLRSPMKFSQNTGAYAATARTRADLSGVWCTSSYGVRPALVLPSSLVALDDGTIIIDAFPVISGEDSDLGTFSTSAPNVSYTVTDEDGDYVSVTIKLDGVVKKTHAVTLGESNTWQLTGDEWLKVTNGSHTITIIADDGYVQTERIYTFTRSMTSMSFTLAVPLPADDMITKAIESIVGSIPANATTKIEVCNNGYDESPTWQDVTPKVLAGEKFQITNTTKTAENWGYNVRVTVSRGEATGDIYINSMGGFFE